MVIPPLAWFAFARASGGEGRQLPQYWHAIGPVLALLCLAVNPVLLDVLIPLSFTLYGLAVLIRLLVARTACPTAPWKTVATPGRHGGLSPWPS